MTGELLITGATGLIGGEIAWRLMRSGRHVWCVVRSRSFAEAAARVQYRFALSGQTCDWSRLVALPGDITRRGLGLAADTIEHLRRECRHVIHCAAETSFADRNRCAEVNLTGTQNVLDLCGVLGPQVRLFYTSSAVTCLKSATGIIREDDARAGFSNDYVLSKRNCEQLVLKCGMDAVVLRPSIVLSQGVNSSEFARSILWVLPVMRRLGVVPLTGQEPIDAVSAGFVASCVVRMLGRYLPHRIYHLSAGPEGRVTLREVFRVLTEQNHDYTQVRFDSTAGGQLDSIGQAAPRRLRRCLDYYLPFLRAGAVYDRQRLEATLAANLPHCPKATTYCAQLLDQFTQREAYAEAMTP